MKFVFDIDMTIMASEFDEKKNRYNLLEPYHQIIKIINKQYDKGHRIVLQTARHWNHFEDTVEQLKRCGIKYHTLVMGNIYADYYINDKNLLPFEFWKMFGGEE